MTIQQRIVFIIPCGTGGASAREQHVIRIYLRGIASGFRLIHTTARKQRFIRFAAHRVSEFFGNTLTASQCPT